MEEALMDCAGKIIRTSIYTFLKHFQFFSTIPILLLLPFSASFLLSQSLFHVSGFPLSLQFQSLSPFAFAFPLPFAVSCFLIAKISVIQALNHQNSSFPPPFSSFILLYKPLLLTHLCSLILIIAITSAGFSLLFFPMNSLETAFWPAVFLPEAGAVVLYCFLVNASFVSNLALVIAGMDGCAGHAAIHKAFLLRKGKGLIALMLFLPTSLGLAAIQALFRYRVIRVYRFSGGISASMAFEGLFIASLFSFLIVLDTIVCCFFYKSCESTSMQSQFDGVFYDIELVQETKCTEELP
ncbi:hypothetical protein SLE2022_191540 [Rubroshorea leprosula]